MLQYEIADCLTRVRNAYMKKHKSTVVRKNKFNTSVLAVLADQGSIKAVSEIEDDANALKVELAYVRGRPSLRSVKISSRPGLRVYMGAKDIPPFKSGLGYGIISTSKGVMTTQQAKQAGIGGELICVVE